MKRGPKPKPPSDLAKFKTIAVDAETVEAITATADRLEDQFGFRPTLSQALRHLLKKVKA